MARWTRAAAEDPTLAASLRAANDEQRRLRPEIDAGVGGETRGGSLKCLHAHVAFALARPGYELGERILAELDPLWPERCCTDWMDAVELIRQEWIDGARRFEELREDPRRYGLLVQQLEAIIDELRKQVGQTYTLAELADAYRDAERWGREVIASPRDVSLVLAAAFHSYQRGAVDYKP